jgi:hypothetical protein
VDAIPALLERFGVCGTKGHHPAHLADSTTSVSSTNS